MRLARFSAFAFVNVAYLDAIPQKSPPSFLSVQQFVFTTRLLLLPFSLLIQRASTSSLPFPFAKHHHFEEGVFPRSLPSLLYLSSLRRASLSAGMAAIPSEVWHTFMIDLVPLYMTPDPANFFPTQFPERSFSCSHRRWTFPSPQRLIAIRTARSRFPSGFYRTWYSPHRRSTSRQASGLLSHVLEREFFSKQESFFGPSPPLRPSGPMPRWIHSHQISHSHSLSTPSVDVTSLFAFPLPYLF